MLAYTTIIFMYNLYVSYERTYTNPNICILDGLAALLVCNVSTQNLNNHYKFYLYVLIGKHRLHMLVQMEYSNSDKENLQSGS